MHGMVIIGPPDTTSLHTGRLILVFAVSVKLRQMGRSREAEGRTQGRGMLTPVFSKPGKLLYQARKVMSL